METLSYDQVCQFVGRLYLESTAQIERLTTKSVELERRLTTAANERDSALKLVAEHPRGVS